MRFSHDRIVYLRKQQQQHDTSPTCYVYVRVVPSLPNLLGRPAVAVGAQPIHDVDPANVLADLAIGIQFHDKLLESVVLLRYKVEKKGRR